MHKKTLINRRTLLGAMATLATAPTRAQGSWPARPVRIVVPFAAAGATDTGARVLADGLSRLLGESVVIENRTGAGGNIGIETVATSPPDGYTFMMGTQAMITWNPHLYQNLRTDPRRDLVAVVSAFSLDMVLVISPKLGAKTMADIIALAKSKPGKLSYGSAGNGSAAHILMEFVKAEAGIDIAHVPYRGTAPALNDLVSGSLDLMIDSLPSALGAIQGGIVAPVAVCGEKRNPRLPEVPTMKEAGLPGINAVPWLGVFAPLGTPQAILDRFQMATKEALTIPGNLERATKVALDSDWKSGSDLARQVEVDDKFWGPIIRKAGIVIN
jgi:tripartite-type tricarboxylate transporter receptor subunit TctC